MKLTPEIYYFDYNSTHIPFSEILRKNLEFYLEHFYNPSGASRFSLAVQNEIEKSRTYFAALTGKKKNEFTFVSTGTEANYMLLNAIAASPALPKKVIVSSYEHSSVYAGIRKTGMEALVLSGNKTGVIDIAELQEQVRLTGAAVFITGAANETGVVQPMEAIAGITREHNVPFYSDLMQAFCKTRINFSLLDGFSMASHKTGGGPGAAVTCVTAKYAPSDYSVFGGGHQENGRRAGTENLPAILSFRDAAEFRQSILDDTIVRLGGYRDKIEKSLEDAGGQIIARDSHRLANTTYVILPVKDIDFLLIALEEKGIIVSTGSSCKSRVREPSATLLNMGYSKEEAMKAIRISTGTFTTDAEVDYLTEHLTAVISQFK